MSNSNAGAVKETPYQQINPGIFPKFRESSPMQNTLEQSNKALGTA
jgi:hypothetical protein